LIIKESIVFANFNSRYQDKLLLSVNAIILFEKLDLIKINDGKVQFTGEKFNFSNPTLGKKAKDRIAAAKKLADILMKGDASELYLSLRIEI
jgi:gentisate 1,2-dioxygenase